MDSGSGQTSPKSRQRLVVASQALEIQHLQDLVRSRERDVSELARRAAADAEEYRKQIAVLSQKNTRLDNQVQLLADKLRQIESSRESSAVDDLQSMKSLAASGQERDKAIAQLRDELRKSRNQASSLVEEREILLEKLVFERAGRADAEARLGSMRNSEGSIASLNHSKQLRSDAAVQTASAGSILDSAIPRVSGKEAIDMLRDHIALEQELLTHHQDLCAQHGANVAELHERLKQCLQGEVRKLQEEQDKYSRMMTAYGSTKNNNVPATPGPMTNQRSFQHTPARSPIPPSGGPAASPSTSFFHLQEQEMLNLKRRLQELQSRHEEVSGGVGGGGGAPLHSVHTSFQHFGAEEAAAPARPAAVQNSAILQRMLQAASTR